MWKPLVPIRWLYGVGLVAEILTLRQQVRKLSRLYAENATERINLYLNASIAENHLSAAEVISQANPLAATGNKLLRTITLMQVRPFHSLNFYYSLKFSHLARVLLVSIFLASMSEMQHNSFSFQPEAGRYFVGAALDQILKTPFYKSRR